MNSEIDDLLNWLNGSREFDAGLMLYIAYINDPDERALLTRQRDGGRLFEALRSRFLQLKVVSKGDWVEISKNGSSDFDEQFLKGYIDKVTERLSGTLMEKLKQEWMILKTEQEAWHTEMRLIGEDKLDLSGREQEQRAKLAELILRHEESLYALGEAMNEVRENGKLPNGFSLSKKVAVKKPAKKAAVPQTDIQKLLRLKNTVNPGISKLKRKIDEAKAAYSDADAKGKEKLAAMLSKWEQQLMDYEQEKKVLNGA